MPSTSKKLFAKILLGLWILLIALLQVMLFGPPEFRARLEFIPGINQLTMLLMRYLTAPYKG